MVSIIDYEGDDDADHNHYGDDGFDYSVNHDREDDDGGVDRDHNWDDNVHHYQPYHHRRNHYHHYHHCLDHVQCHRHHLPITTRTKRLFTETHSLYPL